MSIYLVTYKPLIGKQPGQEAIKQYNIPPYIDGSCRREPDLQSTYPSISALCRGRNFAPRLREEDIVIYMTCQGNYPGLQGPHWRLTAFLEIYRRFSSHTEAAGWYRERQLPLPSNCLVVDNPPIPLDQTTGRIADTAIQGVIPTRYMNRQLSLLNVNPFLFNWDQRYHERVKQWGVFLVCKPLCPIELHDPPAVTREKMVEVFGRIPPTRTPPPITSAQFDKLLHVWNTARFD